MTPIIKIFTQTTDNLTANTTYITQGNNDTGNISIMTSGANHYIELAAAKKFENNLVLEKNSYISVKPNIIEIQANDINNYGYISSGGLNFKLSSIRLVAGNDFDINAKYRSYIQTPIWYASSLSSSAYVNDITQSDYRVSFSSGQSPIIKLEVGLNTSLQLTNSDIKLKINDTALVSNNFYSYFQRNNSSIWMNGNNLSLSANEGTLEIRGKEIGIYIYDDSYVLLPVITARQNDKINFYGNATTASALKDYRDDNKTISIWHSNISSATEFCVWSNTWRGDIIQSMNAENMRSSLGLTNGATTTFNYSNGTLTITT